LISRSSLSSRVIFVENNHKFIYTFLCGWVVVNFIWDSSKNEANVMKHGLAFEDAVHVFEDDHLLEVFDSVHSTPDEARWKAIGMVRKVICVIYTERGEDIRIISARVANAEERYEYYSHYDIG